MGFVIGTAGHIDHGKTALVRALTGQDTDTLQAEKARGISIDLGFAAFDLADGTQVGLVDVPGHERFIRNMVAGAHGLDLVLFLVAADDGVMPQTEEHFHIIRALGIALVIFVISKADRVDAARLDEVRDEIALLADASPFESADILAVDSLSGAGIEALKHAIEHQLERARTKSGSAPFRMPIDRVFTIHGRGMVVTGTVLSGRLAVGDEVTLMPNRAIYRVRGLQSHGSEAEQGLMGTRLAVNLASASKADFQRGDVICAPEIARASQRFDVALHLSPNINAPLRNRQKIRLHLGTAERLARILILGAASNLGGGAQAFAQVSVEVACHVMPGDHFVIRDEQGEHTLGGGIVLDPLGETAKRGSATRLKTLQALSDGDIKSAISVLLENYSGLASPETELRFRFGGDDGLFADPQLVKLHIGTEYWITHVNGLDALVQRIEAILKAFHATYSSETGLNAHDLRGRIAPGITMQVFQAALEYASSKGILQRSDAHYALADHQTGLSRTQQKQADAVLAHLAENPFAPTRPAPGDMDKALIAHLVSEGKIVRLTNGTLFLASAFHKADARLETHLLANNTITAAEFRDLLGTSRKFALALLETFDRMGRTIRVGDARKRGKPLAK
jgi:selenocysteine-specific elongation factor